jgi:hypothetical protein
MISHLPHLNLLVCLSSCHSIVVLCKALPLLLLLHALLDLRDNVQIIIVWWSNRPRASAYYFSGTFTVKLWFSIITLLCRMNHCISCCVTSIAREILSQQLAAPTLVVVLTPVDKVDAFPVFPHHVLEGAHHFPSFHDTMVVVASVGRSRVLIWCRRWIPNAFIMRWLADDVLTFGSCWSLRLFEVVLWLILGYVGAFCLVPSTPFKIEASESKWDHWFAKRSPPPPPIPLRKSHGEGGSDRAAAPKGAHKF